jgi:membrane associated rhomboid family serine protease
LLELLVVPILIIAPLLYAAWRRSYVSQVLIVSNLLIFIYTFVLYHIDYPSFDRVFDSMAFVPARLGQVGYLPSVMTSMFMHASVLHIFGNVLILYLLGVPLEERIGSRNFTVIYFITGIVATLCFFLLHMGSESYLLGASGAIYGIGGAFLILYPRDEIPMLIGPLFMTRAPVWLAVGVMFVIESVLVMLSVDDGTAHIAHVGGLICGLAIAPLTVKERGVKERVGLNYDALRRLARTSDDRALVDKIERETEESVREAWLDFFFERIAQCPRCRRHLKRGEVIECECGEVVDLRG